MNSLSSFGGSKHRLGIILLTNPFGIGDEKMALEVTMSYIKETLNHCSIKNCTVKRI